MTLDVLRSFARPAAARDPSRGPGCELCGAPVAPAHRHVVELRERQLRCACSACSLLFSPSGAASGRLRLVPERVLVDHRWQLRDDEWGRLGIPVKLAFIFYHSELERWTAFYPSPGGLTEAALESDGWRELAESTPLIEQIEPDVEALLVRGERLRPAFDCFLAPVDVCYELAARVRARWTGFDGGAELRSELGEFFAGLRRRSKPLASDAGGIG